MVELDRFVQDPSPMSFGIYVGGIVLVLAGLVYGAAILHVPVPWIVVGALVSLGLGVLTAVKATRMRDRAG
jgi:cadmium resistance protein CadD (predicted permease)